MAKTRLGAVETGPRVARTGRWTLTKCIHPSCRSVRFSKTAKAGTVESEVKCVRSALQVVEMCEHSTYLFESAAIHQVSNEKRSERAMRSVCVIKPSKLNFSKIKLEIEIVSCKKQKSTLIFA